MCKCVSVQVAQYQGNDWKQMSPFNNYGSSTGALLYFFPPAMDTSVCSLLPRKIGTIGIGMVVGYQVHTGKSAFKMER